MAIESLHPITQFPVIPVEALVRKTSLDKASAFGGIKVAGVLPDVSPLAVILSEEGLDFSHSSVDKSYDEFSFDLNFSHKRVEKLSANGTYNSHTRSLELNLTYTRQTQDNDVQPPVARTLSTEIHLSVSEVRSRVYSPTIKEEDILSMVRQFLGELQSSSSSLGVDRSGAELDKADLDKLQSSSGSGAAQSLEKLIHLVMLLARLKEILESDPHELAPIEAVDPASIDEKITALSISVREIPGSTNPGPDTKNASVPTDSAGELNGGAFLQPERFSPVPAALS